MASVLDKYGIKEVCDVMFYKINNDGTPGEPVLYIDTAKVFTTESTAENTSARGGKGNPEIIAWDFNKEINVTFEDALFSMRSMAIMFGASTITVSNSYKELRKTIQFTATNTSAGPTQWTDVNGNTHAISSPSYYDESGSQQTTLTVGNKYFSVFNIDGAGNGVDAMTIEVSSATFPGTYYITGDTFARSEATGEDEYFQLIFPKAKVLGENTLTTQAEGDPSTFSMNLKVLRATDGNMMKLIKYNVGNN